MHVRTGLDTEYLGSEFMDIVRSCVDVAEEKGMLACLYDEDRWPSGTAGGRVVEGEEGYRGRHLLFTMDKYGTVGGPGGCSPASGEACRSENGWLLGRFGVRLGGEGEVVGYRVLGEGEEGGEGEGVWYAYVETNPPSAWFNGQTYVDTLNPEAMKAFIGSTHEKYRDCVGDRFGGTVPCIFTDEPQFARKTRLGDGRERRDVFLPWTDDLPETFSAAYGGEADLVKHLPELIWNLPNGKVSVTRYRFHDHVCERFVTAFMDQLGDWCVNNGILLNGHMMDEPTLGSQTNALGEAMRCYRSMGLPGMDLLNDSVEFNTAKQVSSVARQRGIKGVMSEIYGCTHWYFTFEGHKGCGDWQAALGITFRVPHLAWASMAGEAKRDYPASLNYQSPWYKEYGYVEDHFARVGVAMTRGTAMTRVAVVHPVESFWCLFGPDGGGNGEKLREREGRFGQLTDWLLRGLVDFDFISESLLPEMYGGVEDKELVVGECRYEAVIVPDLLTIRSSTVEILNELGSKGGRVIVLDREPKLVDGQELPADKAQHPIINSSVSVPWDRDAVLSTLEQHRDLDIVDKAQKRPDSLLYQQRVDGDERFVFICNTDRSTGVETTIHLRGFWDVDLLETLSGKQTRLESRLFLRGTSFPYHFEGCGSLLLRLSPRSTPDCKSLVYALQDPPSSVQDDETTREVGLTLDDVEFSEPNVLMLDYARYEVFTADAPVYKSSGVQEILAINNEILDRLHLPRKGQAWRQPWTLPESDRKTKAAVALHFPFLSEMDVTVKTQLAIELPDSISISINDTGIFTKHICGLMPNTWWVDEAISTVPIPPNVIKKGLNTLSLSFPFDILTNIERIYILGTFKVQLGDFGSDTKAKIIPWDTKADPLTWGSIIPQHLPFYVGNITYRCTFTLPARAAAKLSVPEFESPVLAVQHGKDKEKRGRIAFRPRELELGVLGEGRHEVEITCFGNRYNAFGHVHALDSMTTCWPDAWRTQGWAWTDEYRVKAVGVLGRPVVLYRREVDGWVVVSPPATP